MALTDALATYRARLAANVPSLSLADDTVLMQIASAALQDGEDTRYLLAQAQLQLFIATATGTYLDAKAADYNVSRSLGLQATGQVVFKVQQAPTSPLTFPAGTRVSTVGDGVTTQPQVFETAAAATIAAGTTSSPAVGVTAERPGIAGNVAAGAITVILTSVSSTATVSNAVGDGGAATTGGTDPDSDAVLRAKILTVALPRFGTTAVEAAILAVSGVYDAYVPPGGTGGAFTYNWIDTSGGQASGTATAVTDAVANAIPPSVVATSATFSVTAITGINVSYTAPIASATIQPQIQAAIAAYINGTGTARSGLMHGQWPTIFGMAQAVQQETGFVLTNLTLNSINGSTTLPSSASATTLYRITTTPATSAISFT